MSASPVRNLSAIWIAGLCLCASATAANGPGGIAPEPVAGSSSTGTPILLVSRADGSAGKPSDAAQAGSISADGRFAAFAAEGDIFVRDLRRARTRRLAVGAGSPELSADARFLAYDSDGSVFVRNLATGATALVSKQLAQLPPNDGTGFSSDPSISADGRYVAFESYRRGLVDEDGDRQPDESYPRYQLYLRDLKTRTTTLISRASGADGAIGDGESSQPSISADGRYVAFTSEAGNLLPGAPRPGIGVYVRDLATGALKRVSHFHSRPGPHRTDASQPSISADGRYVAFHFTRVGSPPSVVVRDLLTGHAVNASLLRRTPLKLGSGAPAISADGRYLAFSSAGPIGGEREKLYLVDLRTHRTKFVQVVGTGDGGPLSFSAAGRYLLFDTFVDSNVPKGDEPLIPAHGEAYRYTNPLAQ